MTILAEAPCPPAVHVPSGPLDEWWPATVELLAPLGPSPCRADPRFSLRPAAKGSAVLTFHDIDLNGGFANLRATVIQGGPAAIFNVMIFPCADASLPIFASEIVCFGPNVRVAVVDLQHADPARRGDLEMNAAFRDVAIAAREFPSGGEQPAWCADYFTRHALWSRDMPLADLGRLLDAYRGYLAVWCAMACEAESRPATDSRHDLVAQYKAHHIAHSPGLAFLGKVFGEQWTHAFLREGMYS